MAVLIAAGVKVAGKALIKKLGTKLAQAGAKKIAQQGAQTLAQEGVKKIGTSVAQKGVMSNAGGQIKKAKNLFDKAQDIKKTKDSILGKSKKDQQTEESSENQPQKKSENKWPFYIAIFFALVKDALEIFAVPVAPFLVFLPTGIISCILLLSGKKGTMKIITGLLSTIIDTLIPGLNILPITSIAVFVIMKPEGGKLLNINSQQMSKIMKSVKKFIK